MSEDEGLDDARLRSRARTCVTYGALGGGLVGVLAALALPGLTFAAGGVGLLAGALAGRVLAARFDVQEWEPGPGHSFVGVHAPDEDAEA